MTRPLGSCVRPGLVKAVVLRGYNMLWVYLYYGSVALVCIFVGGRSRLSLYSMNYAVIIVMKEIFILMRLVIWFFQAHGSWFAGGQFMNSS